MINIYVQKTQARAVLDAPVTSGSVGREVQFQFSDDWDGLTKTAVFETNNYKEPRQVPESGTVKIPEGVLAYPGYQLRIGVIGKSADGTTVIPTVYADCDAIKPGASTVPVGTPPTPSQAEQLQAQIDDLANAGKPTDGQVSIAVNAWLDEHPEATTTVTDGSITKEKLNPVFWAGVEEQIREAAASGGAKWALISDGEIFELSTEEEPAIPVPCTGITLDKTELAFSDTETSITLGATVTPFDTTDSIEWSVDNSGVATVENGVVKAITNGSCVVTAKCGAYSATCAVTVKIVASYTKAGLLSYYDFADYADDYAGEISNKYPEANSGMFAAVRVQNRHATQATQLGIKNGVLRVGGEAIGATGADAYMQIYNAENRVFVSAYPYSVEFYSRVRGGFDNGVEGEIGYGTTWAQPGKAGLVTTRMAIDDEADAASRNALSKRGTDVYFNSNMHTLRTGGSVAQGAQDIALPDTYVIDEYHHYVVCVDSALVRVYIDGVLVGEGTETNNALTETETACSFPFNGDIKMVRVYNAILTDEQVANNYSNTIATYGGDA